VELPGVDQVSVMVAVPVAAPAWPVRAGSGGDGRSALLRWCRRDGSKIGVVADMQVESTQTGSVTGASAAAFVGYGERPPTVLGR